MKLILTTEVEHLGSPGDTVEVKDGYGRNYLLPRGLAIVATRGAQRQAETIRRTQELKGVKNLEHANELKTAIENLGAVQLSVKTAGDSGKLFGSVTAADIAAAITRADGPSAVVAANDQMALGLIAGLREAGLDIPGEVSVIGFDDNPDAAFYRPPLTTVRIDLAGEARRVVAAVLGAPVLPSAPPVVVPRASAAAPRGMLHP